MRVSVVTYSSVDNTGNVRGEGGAINNRLESGSDPSRAVLEGAFSRLRQALMTAYVAAPGWIPMLHFLGASPEIQRPLEPVVVGGLFSSTLLTLVVLPALYKVFSNGVLNRQEET
jgi:cobalt-zinc-cadmium resistance protein CzcA